VAPGIVPAGGGLVPRLQPSPPCASAGGKPRPHPEAASAFTVSGPQYIYSGRATPGSYLFLFIFVLFFYLSSP